MSSADPIAERRNLNRTSQTRDFGPSSSSSHKQKTRTRTSTRRTAGDEEGSSSSNIRDKGKGKAKESLVPGPDTNASEETKKISAREKLVQIRRGLQETEGERAEIQRQVKEVKAVTHEIRSSQQDIRQRQFYFSSLANEEQEELDRSVQRLAKLYEDAEEVNTQLLEELKEANEKISRLESELDDVRKELEIERRRGDSLQKDVDDLEQEVASLEEIVAALGAKLDETEKELARSKEDVDETRASVSPRRYPSSQVTNQGLSTEDLQSGQSSRKKRSKRQGCNKQIEGSPPELIIESQEQTVPVERRFSGSSSKPGDQRRSGKPKTKFFIVLNAQAPHIKCSYRTPKMKHVAGSPPQPPRHHPTSLSHNGNKFGSLNAYSTKQSASLSTFPNAHATCYVYLSDIAGKAQNSLRKEDSGRRNAGINSEIRI
ncbi:hypothetical protein DL95DRAFT_441565 [Leptodontidium sp. 2 PMI_412]|nr:hypothetical protein DL95DRAFT_441565 [Leptodontidium sp. 2 PMI_412]